MELLHHGNAAGGSADLAKFSAQSKPLTIQNVIVLVIKEHVKWQMCVYNMYLKNLRISFKTLISSTDKYVCFSCETASEQ